MRALLVVSSLVCSTTAGAQECANPDPDWIFCDDFESGISATWLEIDNVDLTTEVFQGSQAIAITSQKGVDNGGGMKLDMAPGYDTLHLRFFVKLSANFGYMHHFVQLAGRGPTRPLWFPFGSAGCLPSGSNFFTSGLEIDGSFHGGTTPGLPIPGRWTFYTYYMDMSGWGTGTATCIATCADCTANRDSGNCNDTCFHGNAFAPSPDVMPNLDTWYCMEMQITVNDVGSSNGSQTMWRDGVELGDFPNLRWRSDVDLKVNSLLLQHYTTADHLYAPGQDQQTAFFDNVVLSTSYIGCTGQSTQDGGAQDGSVPDGAIESDGAGPDGHSPGDPTLPDDGSSPGDNQPQGEADDPSGAPVSLVAGCDCSTAPAPWLVCLGLLLLQRRRRFRRATLR